MSESKVSRNYLWRNNPFKKWNWRISFLDGTYISGSAWRYKTARDTMNSMTTKLLTEERRRERTSE